MNKKSLREVFEFFPNAKWVTQDENGSETIHSNNPTTKGCVGLWASRGYKLDLSRLVGFMRSTEGENLIFEIDWQHRKTWKQRCVSREEVMGE